MRHLRSILYALVLAPAVWILCGVGFDQDLTGRARDNGGIESLSGVLLLVLAGTAYAILLFSPISPAGPLLAGLAFLTVGAWARVAPDSYAGVWPTTIADDGFDVSTPGYGLAVLLAVPLLATALSARRWRSFEPADIVLLGTIGRAGGAAGTPMAEERTTVIPQQRQAPGFVPGFGGPSAEATQIVPPSRPARGIPQPAMATDDGDEKTTVMRLGPQPVAEEPTQIVTPAAVTGDPSGNEPTRDMAADEQTEDVAFDEPTQLVTASRAAPTAAHEEATADVAAPEPAREPAPEPAPQSAPGSVGDETTRDVTADESTEDETTRLALPPAADEDEKTQLLTLPKADTRRSPAPADDGDRTQVVRSGTVEAPGDRTQLLTFPAPAEPTTVETPAAAETEPMSIVAAERPDPGEDPTTRITPLVKEPGEATTRANPDRRAMTVTNLERPADEAADDTRPLTLPAQRPPADEEATHRL